MMMMMTTEMHGSAIENLSSPDKVHPVANNENKIILTNLTKNNTVVILMIDGHFYLLSTRV